MDFHHIGIETSSLDESLSFYQDILQFTVKQRLNLGGEELVFISDGRLMLELIKVGEVSRKEAGCLHLCFRTKNLKKLKERLKSRGMQDSFELNCYENGWKSLFIKGPSGEEIEFLTHDEESRG
ncbi:VOC family protein [Peribacillus sp. SCS-37]|uniref:VOC family protein n=1 Tax=Paraperibacillus esterisolvens TaxID=3115296 RepID=UPI0039062E66